MFIAFAGLPGTGKSTIAQCLAERLKAVYLRIDTIEQAIRSAGILPPETDLGNAVIADSVNPLKITRDAYREVAEQAGVAFLEVEIVCLEKAEHRRRVEMRRSTVEGLAPPSWEDVETLHYETWDRAHVQIDSATLSVAESLQLIMTAIDRMGKRGGGYPWMPEPGTRASVSIATPGGERLRIAIAQTQVTFDPQVNGAEIRNQMRLAAEAGARLIQFTEGAISGYPSGAGKQTLAGWNVDWPVLRDELEATAALAAELRLWTVVGSNHPLTPPNRPHNSLYVISDKGELAGRYDKRLLSFTEVSDWYSPGSEKLIFEVDGFRFGCMLCIEIQFPELFVEYAGENVDVVLLSTFSRDPMFAIQAQGHAACGAFWLGFSVPAQCSEAASAGLIGPDGGWIARAAEDGSSTLVIAELDRSADALQGALKYARPWRVRARNGKLHDQARVVDYRSLDKNRF